MNREVVVGFIKDRKSKTIQTFLENCLQLGSKHILHTDGWAAYYGLDWKKLGYRWRRNIHVGACYEKYGKIEFIGGKDKGKKMVIEFQFDPDFGFIKEKQN